jgi:hypothetical protein
MARGCREIPGVYPPLPGPSGVDLPIPNSQEKELAALMVGRICLLSLPVVCESGMHAGQEKEIDDQAQIGFSLT